MDMITTYPRTICFSWEQEQIQGLGKMGNPTGLIYIWDEGKSIWRGSEVYIDSGAVISVFSREIGNLVLPNRVESGEKKTFGSASGGEIETYIHRVNLRLGPFLFPARVAFRKDESIKRNLLGRCDVFSFFSIYFDHIKRRTCFIG
ncbi:MAG: hypothetical protein QME42_06755 [bacterium]|nr:hypothetical protein [bacterium]